MPLPLWGTREAHKPEKCLERIYQRLWTAPEMTPASLRQHAKPSRRPQGPQHRTVLWTAPGAHRPLRGGRSCNSNRPPHRARAPRAARAPRQAKKPRDQPSRASHEASEILVGVTVSNRSGVIYYDTPEYKYLDICEPLIVVRPERVKPVTLRETLSVPGNQGVDGAFWSGNGSPGRPSPRRGIARPIWGKCRSTVEPGFDAFCCLK
jgi:hypothetical protein